uniref:Uncharacterized protein n=1 Tax=Ditylenchus dipsaci TaxID=166011 RepID=A0A915E7F5_9BILA
MNSFTAFVCLAILAFTFHATSSVPRRSNKYISNSKLSYNRDNIVSDDTGHEMTVDMKHCLMELKPQLEHCESTNTTEINQPTDLCPMMQESVLCMVEIVEESCGEIALEHFKKAIELYLDKHVENLPKCKKLIQWVESNDGKFLGQKVNQ